MKTRILLVFTVVAMALLSACSKDKDKTNAEMIVGKWALVTDVANSKYQGVLHVETYTGTDTDYSEFKADGTCLSAKNGDISSGKYSINGDQLIIDTDTYTIKSLTDNQLVLYSMYEYTDANKYFEFTLTYKR